MAENQDQQQKSTVGPDSPKPGSDRDAAHEVGGKGDFGVPVDRVRDRTYVSNNTKMADPGNTEPHAGTTETARGRVAGVGGNDSGAGSSSGGDVDTDFIG